jgi:hypothetical protein
VLPNGRLAATAAIAEEPSDTADGAFVTNPLLRLVHDPVCPSV